MEQKKVNACYECKHNEWDDHKVYKMVTGQVEGPAKEITVAICANCGWKQEVFDSE
jgi:hypothetical protein